MPKTTLNKKMAQKIGATQKKVELHRAHKVGTLKSAFDRVTLVANALALLHAEADKTLQGEIDLLRMICRRFITRIKGQQHTRTGLLQKAFDEVTALERELDDAAGLKGYQLKKLARESSRDLALTARLRQHLNVRAREAAYVLAELEQAVNPVSGLKLANATQRAQNEKRRKEVIAKFQKPADTGAEAPAVEQSSAESTS